LFFSAAATLAALQSVKVAKTAAEDAAAGAAAAAESVKVSKRALFAERRPWVGVFGIDIEKLEIGEEGATARVELLVKNTGGSPAHGLGVRANLTAESRPEGTVEDITRRFNHPIRGPDPDFTLCVFPGQDHLLTFDLIGPREDIDAHPEMAGEMGGERRLIFTLSGFILYESGVAEARTFHATSFVYRVARSRDSHIILRSEDSFVQMTDGFQIKPWTRGWYAD
jgi:hypothetical protein